MKHTIDNQKSHKRDNLMNISMCQRSKWQILSNEEKVYMYFKLKSNDADKRHLMQNFSISQGTI